MKTPWPARSRSGWLLALLLPVLLAACDRAPKVPVEYPFVLQEGHRLQGEFRVGEDALYAVQLVYRFDTEAQRKLARWRAGDTGLGADATLSVTVRRRSDGRVMAAQTVSRPKLSSWNSHGLWSDVVRVRLPRGAYVFDLRVDAAEASLREQPMDVEVRRAYVGK